MFWSRIRSFLLFLTLSATATSGSASAQSSRISFTTTEGTWISLDVAPNGGSLVFELLGDIYSLSVEGGNARALLTGHAFQSQARFSPDGTHLAYVSDGSGSDNVWIALSDGTEARPLSNVRRATMLSPAWSADGSAVFVTQIALGMQRVAELWRYDVDTGEGIRIVENNNGRSAPLVSSPAPGPYGAAPSPDGVSLYYTSVTPRPYGSRSGASSAVYHLDLESGEKQRVHLEGLNAMKPAVSPDGRRMVYAAMKDGHTGLKVRDIDSGLERWLAYPIQRHQLEGRATRDVLPNFAIAPDGESVFLEWNGRIHRLGMDDESDHLVPFEADVSLAVEPRLEFPRRVETGPVSARRAQHLAVAADGRVAFSTLARIWIADQDSETPERLTDTERSREFSPAWSPNGRWIAFVTWDATGGHLWKARSDGRGDPVQLSTTSALWIDPAWTPDGSGVVALMAPLGSTLATRGPVPPDAQVVVVPAEGGATSKVMPANGLRHPHFIDNPERIYLSSPQAGLVSVDLEGNNRRVETHLNRDAGFGDLRMSPDGRFLLCIIGRRVLRVPVPTTGFEGIELSLDQATTLTDEAPTSVAWSGDGASVSWITGLVLSRVEAAGTVEGRQDVSLHVEVPRPAPSGDVVFRGATVLTMRGYETVDDGDVVVRNNRIVGVGPSNTIPVPAGARIVDVRGKFIVPGFIDIHAHLGTAQELLRPESSSSFANLAYGITTVRDPQANPDVFAVADIIEADAVPGPRTFSTGPGLFSMTDFQSLDEVRQTLQTYRDEYRTHLIKEYLVGTRQQRQWVVQAAREMGMMVTNEGGADTKGDLTHAVDGFSGNEHNFPVAPIYDDLVQLYARTGITYTPTLIVSFGGALPIYRLLAEERPHENVRISRWFGDGALFARSSSRVLWFPSEDHNNVEVGEGVNAILQAGGRVGLGGHGEVQGLSNHWEMKLLARGGMKPHDILRVATIFGAEAIGFEQDLGSLEPGKLADLAVLDRNPLENIEATQSIRYVMKNGVLYDGETLDQLWPREEQLVRPWWLARPSGAAGAHTAIDHLVRRTMDEARIPGVAVAVVRRGEVVLSKGYGVANLETGTPVTAETMFQSGSLGKQFTSAGVLALVEDGRIGLDTSVRIYIPEAPESWQTITVRHLLTHSSGIPDYTGENFDYETDYTEIDLVRMASELELEFPAGSRWNYSNTGYVMLGVILGRVTGDNYWEFLRERIFDPAGMTTIRVNTENDIVLNRARGYLPVEGGWRHAGYVAPTTNTTADGSMLLNLHDLIAWNEAVRNRRVLQSESWDIILSPMTLTSGRTYPYGFGWFLDEVGGQIIHQHGGAWQGFVTQFTRFTGDDLAVIVLANARSVAPSELANGIAALLNPALAPVPPPTTPIRDTDPTATTFVREILSKVASGNLELADFAFVRQTVFPRMRTALTSALQGLGSPDRLELLQMQEIGDDRALQYWAWYGERRFRILVSLGPQGGLTALRAIPEDR